MNQKVFFFTCKELTGLGMTLNTSSYSESSLKMMLRLVDSFEHRISAFFKCMCPDISKAKYMEIFQM